MNKLPARTGIVWLKQGFNLFRQQPFLLTTLIFLQLISLLLLARVPVLGQVAPLILLPAFAMSIQQACHLIDEGRPVTIMVILTGFQGESLSPLLKLGAVYLVVFMVIMLAMMPFIDMAALEQFSKTMQANAGSPRPTMDPEVAASLVTYMVIPFLFMLVMLLLSFAPALTHWKKMPTFKAIFYSIFAVFGTAAPVLTLIAALTGITLLALPVIGVVLGATSLVQLVLVWFSMIISLVFQCALYVAYKQIMGAPGSEPAPK